MSLESEAQTEAVHEFAGRRLRDAEQMYTKGRRQLVTHRLDICSECP